MITVIQTNILNFPIVRNNWNRLIKSQTNDESGEQNSTERNVNYKRLLK